MCYKHQGSQSGLLLEEKSMFEERLYFRPQLYFFPFG